MTILPLDPAANATPEALRAFLGQCQAAAVKAGRPQLVSISLEVDALDPLAVLESIFESTERHFYVERPAEDFAVAGAEAVLTFTASGDDRFSRCQQFIDESLAHALVVGDQRAPFAGPHFFCAFSFLGQTEPGEPFEAASVFVPRWQVAHRSGRTVAVANLVVDSRSPLDALAERVWRARKKFQCFEYREVSEDRMNGANVGGVPSPRSAAMRGEGTPTTLEYREMGDYCGAVARALEEIASGEFEKIVLARAKDLISDQPLHPLLLLNGLRQRFNDCYAFSVANGRGQSFIGATPERLLRVSDGTLLTEALAGTARRGATASEDAALAATLLRSEKDLREQRIVLDSIVRRLEPLGLKPEFAARPELRRLANVQHLQTALRAVLPAKVRALDVLARLHPTPAVGGNPSETVIPRIREFEGFPRGLYAGALGWIDSRGGAEFFVGLRSALVAGSRARLYAGAGIVAGSSPDKELAETELKFNAMQDALGSA